MCCVVVVVRCVVVVVTVYCGCGALRVVDTVCCGALCCVCPLHIRVRYTYHRVDLNPSDGHTPQHTVTQQTTGTAAQKKPAAA